MEEGESSRSFSSSPAALPILDNTTAVALPSKSRTLSSNTSISSFQIINGEFHLPDIIQLEWKALDTGDIKDAITCWSIPLYAQRKYWFKLFIGFNYGIFATFLLNWTMRGIPDPTFSEPTLHLYRYLGENAGIESVEDSRVHEFLGTEDGVKSAELLERFLEEQSDQTPPLNDQKSQSKGSSPITQRSTSSSRSTSPRPRFPWDDLVSAALRTGDKLETGAILPGQKVKLIKCRQSKLSQEQLSELQRSTHFDKKELQQWYKGTMIFFPKLSSC